MKKKILIGLAASVIAILVFLTWYSIHYSMDIAEPFEVNTPDEKIKVLIATQGSEFKGAIVDGIIEHLKNKSAYINVIDVTSLQQVHTGQWSVIVLIHTWEHMKPQEDAELFLDRLGDLSNVVVLTTSGNGNYKMNGINAISSASEMTDVSARVSDINERIEVILRTKGFSMEENRGHNTD